MVFWSVSTNKHSISDHKVMPVTARSTTVYGLHMCNDISVQHRETLYNDEGFLKYVCLNFSLFHWIFLSSAVIVIFVNAFLQIFLKFSNVTCSGVCHDEMPECDEA